MLQRAPRSIATLRYGDINYVVCGDFHVQLQVQFVVH